MVVLNIIKYQYSSINILIYTLWLFNSSPWYRCPTEIDGLPINSMVIFHGYVR